MGGERGGYACGRGGVGGRREKGRWRRYETKMRYSEQLIPHLYNVSRVEYVNAEREPHF